MQGDAAARLLLEIERAALLGALDRNAQAEAAFIDILRRHPTHFSALNECGTWLAAQGAIDAACRVVWRKEKRIGITFETE